MESMGYIYASASEVPVVLSAASPALTRVFSSSRLSTADLTVLECEEWVERAWTYQESVNGDVLFLTCEGEVRPAPSSPAERFLNSVGYALTHFKGSIADKLRVYPRLNAFEDIMSDWFTAGYRDRAALKAMSNMDWRVQGRAEDHFYAMIGASSKEVASETGAVKPCEVFMRPDNMVVLYPALPKEEARWFVRDWLTAFGEGGFHVEENLEDALRVMGFKGSSQCVTTTEGYLLPFKPVKTEQALQILVSTTLRLGMGAPGSISYEEEGEKTALYYPGVYIRLVDGRNVFSILVGW
ncbi:hypothetical protein BCR34DRAFT_604886 [Clohesyomyces aquaticus]|uniref:Uncharacterized protein n=1 Tax=Clohesyomyces aquaticus TaxID=1231657 RepID=A0A1Y1Z2P3_9PLEO|nr:hypothetical protein BCR34DRAFT_604886 [Clohesyomyces aquaticus]